MLSSLTKITAGLAATAICATHAHAAYIDGSVTNATAGFVNLAEEGTADWIHTDNPGSVVTYKTGAPFLISAPYTVTADGDAGELREVGGTDLFYSTTPGATTGDSFLDSLANDQLDDDGEGIGFTITVPTTDVYIATVYIGAYITDENPLTASLPGATTYLGETSGGNAPGAKSKTVYAWTLEFQADAVDGVSNVLTLSAALDEAGTSSSNSHVSLQAVTLAPAPTAIPEPASALLLLAGSIPLIARRRR